MTPQEFEELVTTLVGYMHDETLEEQNEYHEQVIATLAEEAATKNAACPTDCYSGQALLVPDPDSNPR